MKSISIKTADETEFIDITNQIGALIRENALNNGLLFIYVPHTTAGVTITEGADPSVQRDIMAVLNKIVPRGFDYRHLEGNSPAHVKASLIGSSVTVMVENAAICLGAWQKIFFCEFDGPRSRKIWVKFYRQDSLKC